VDLRLRACVLRKGHGGGGRRRRRMDGWGLNYGCGYDMEGKGREGKGRLCWVAETIRCQGDDIGIPNALLWVRR